MKTHLDYGNDTNKKFIAQKNRNLEINKRWPFSALFNLI